MMNSPVVDITDLSKYYGKARGIEHISLDIGEGEIFGFIGPNGAGKSTTIRILMNLIFPTAGSARILGRDVIRDTKEIKRLTGYIPSDANAYSSMDVEEFLGYCARFHGTLVSRDRISQLSEMFDLDTKRRIADLSFGNRKKVSIVQSFLHNPRVLIADEPTTGLDPLMQAVFFDLLRAENRKGMTIFYSSHVLSEVQQLCKRVAIIKEGRIIQVEDIETLRKKQLRKISVEFSRETDAAGFTIPGIEKLISISGRMLSFMYSGNINDLVRTVSGMSITDMMIEEPSLDEIFMHYYKS